MCSFYNPNIQSNFDEIDYNFDFIRGLTLGKFKIIYQVSNLNAKNRFKFKKFDNPIQQKNLKFVDENFPKTFADIALSTIVSGVHSLIEYEKFKQLKIDKNNKGVFLSQRLDHFIEMLVFSDIANAEQLSDGVVNFEKITCLKDFDDNNGFYTMFERLKLYEFLKQNMKVIVQNEETYLTDDSLFLSIQLSVM